MCVCVCVCVCMCECVCVCVRVVFFSCLFSFFFFRTLTTLSDFVVSPCVFWLHCQEYLAVSESEFWQWFRAIEGRENQWIITE